MYIIVFNIHDRYIIINIIKAMFVQTNIAYFWLKDYETRKIYLEKQLN